MSKKYQCTTCFRKLKHPKWFKGEPYGRGCWKKVYNWKENQQYLIAEALKNPPLFMMDHPLPGLPTLPFQFPIEVKQ